LPLFHDIDYRIAGPRVKKLNLSSSPPYVNYAELGKVETAGPAVFRKAGGGVIHVPIDGEIESLDPSLAARVTQTEVLPSIFEALTAEKEGARIVPRLADFQAEQGGRRFRFRLRDDLRFHDGRRLTARDVRYSFEHLLQNQTGELRSFLSPIRGAKEFLNGERGELKGFQIVSAQEFTVDLEQPVSFFPALVSYSGTAIVPEGTERFGGSWRDGCVGTGPYRVVSFDPGRRLELEANPYYWRKGYPKNDGLVFTFGVSAQEILSGFRAGRFSLAWDLLPSDVETLRHEPEFASRYRETPRLSNYFLVFNIHRGPFTDEKLRHRLIQSIDVQALIRRNLGRLAVPAHGVIPPGLIGYEQARRVTTTSSEKVQSKVDIELNGAIHTMFEGAYASFAKELFESLEIHGFHVGIGQTKSETVAKALLTPKVDFDLLRWVGDYPDADTFVGLLHSKEGYIGGYCGTPEVDRLIERGRTETDPEIRHDIYREIEDTVVRRALVLPLFHEQSYRFARPELEGFEMTFSMYQPVPYEKLWLRR
jgi:oligopeptide transport system substrate-binding protein